MSDFDQQMEAANKIMKENQEVLRALADPGPEHNPEIAEVRCDRCFGRGHLFRNTKRRIRGEVLEGVYAYPCPGCGGRGQRNILKVGPKSESTATRKKQ